MKKIKDNIKYIIIVIVVLCLIGIYLVYYCLNNTKDEPIKRVEPIKKEIKKIEEKYLYVDIKGEVNSPGVYKMKEGSRVIDVVNASGGLKENADTSIINLSKKIFDEMFIIIYTKDEIDKYKKETISTKEINAKLQKNIISVDENNDAQIKKKNNVENKDTKININIASKEELTTITGIGESKAQSIIDYRDENGNFNTIDDLKNISGIGDALFEKIKEYITV